MGVYIPKITMPKNCRECRFLEGDTMDGLCHAANKWLDDESFLWHYYAEGDIDDSMPFNCPLIELPPHGDLIDRKALSMTDFEIATCTLAKGNPYKNGLEYLLNKIENAPTIIGEETCNKSEDDGVNASIEAERGKE